MQSSDGFNRTICITSHRLMTRLADFIISTECSRALEEIDQSALHCIVWWCGLQIICLKIRIKISREMIRGSEFNKLLWIIKVATPSIYASIRTFTLLFVDAYLDIDRIQSTLDTDKSKILEEEAVKRYCRRIRKTESVRWWQNLPVSPRTIHPFKSCMKHYPIKLYFLCYWMKIRIQTKHLA